VRTFNEVAKIEEGLTHLYSRYSSGSELQKKIDRAALKMIGLEWSDEQLDELYGAIKFELDVMQRILEGSSKARRKAGRKKREEGGESSKATQISLDRWASKRPNSNQVP
jgi:hypothetical protein